MVSSCGSWPVISVREGKLAITRGNYQFSTHTAAKTWSFLYLLGIRQPRAFRLAPMFLHPGNSSLPFPLTPNPRFFERMMGWPTNWTALDSQVTELSLWLRHMRCALSYCGQ